MTGCRFLARILLLLTICILKEQFFFPFGKVVIEVLYTHVTLQECGCPTGWIDHMHHLGPRHPRTDPMDA